MTNTRTEPRFSIQVVAEISVGGEVMVSSTQNISLGGAAIVLDRQLTPGAKVGVSLFLTQDGIEDPDEEPLDTEATIAWCKPGLKGTFTAGLKLVELKPVEKQRLAHFIETARK